LRVLFPGAEVGDNLSLVHTSKVVDPDKRAGVSTKFDNQTHS